MATQGRKIVTAISDEAKSALIEKLKTDPLYSLEADPTGALNLTNEEKRFIELYINYRNFGVVSTMMNIKVEDAVNIYMKFDVKNEIERINSAIYKHQYCKKMIDIDEIGGYLSSLMDDSFVPEVDRLKPMDKVKVADMILKVRQIQNEILQRNQEIIDVGKTDDALKELSVSSIKQLIDNIESGDSALDEETEQKIKDSTMSPSDIDALKSLPTTDIISILNEATKQESIDETKEEPEQKKRGRKKK